MAWFAGSYPGACYLGMVLRDPRDERVARHLGLLNREVAAADRIIRGLLDYARGA